MKWKLLTLFSALSFTAFNYAMIPINSRYAAPDGPFAMVQLGLSLPEDDLYPLHTPIHNKTDFSHISNDWHLKYTLGYQIEPGVAMQLGYLQMVNLTGANGSAYNAKLRYWDFAARGLLAVTDRTTVVGILGLVYAQQRVKGAAANDGIKNGSANKLTFEIGLGLRLSINKHLALTFEPTYIFPAKPIRYSLYFPVGFSYVF